MWPTRTETMLNFDKGCLRCYYFAFHLSCESVTVVGSLESSCKIICVYTTRSASSYPRYFILNTTQTNASTCFPLPSNSRLRGPLSYPSCHRARDIVHPRQVTSLLQG